MPSLSLNSLITISKKNTESQEEFRPQHDQESQNNTTSSRKRPRITFDDNYDNDNDNRPSRPSLSFRELGMLDSAAQPTTKRRNTKTPKLSKMKNIKRSHDSNENVQNGKGDGDGDGFLESEEVEIIFEDAPSSSKHKQGQRATRNNSNNNSKSRLPDADPESLGMLYYHHQPTSSLPDDLLQKMMRALEPPLINPFHHISRVERLQPRSRKSRKRHQQHVQLWETPQQAKIRVLKYDRAKEWNCMRYATKERLYDYTKEVDVGGAIAKMARRVLQETYQNQQMRTSRQTKLKKWAATLQQQDSVDATTTRQPLSQAAHQTLLQQRQQEDPNDHYHSRLSDDDESSVDEQKQVLERLLSPQSQQQPTNEEREKDEANATQLKLLQELSTPFSKRMTYWERGRATPQSSCEFDYMDKQHLRGALIPQAPMNDDDDDDGGKLRITMRELLLSFNTKMYGDSFYHFPWRRNLMRTKNRVTTQMRHFRQLRRLAYRYLCGGTGHGNDIQAENRLIRLLQSTFRASHGNKSKNGYDFNQTSHGAILQLLARRQGRDLQMYLQSHWTNPSETARRLGLVHDPRHAYHCSGWIMNPGYIGGSKFALKLRKQLEDQEKISEMPWDHQDDDEDQQEEPDMNGIDAYPGFAQVTESSSVPAEHNSDNAVRPDVAKSLDNLQGLDMAARNPVSKYIPPSRRVGGEEDIWNKTIVKPTCSYMHVAGTTPPIPNFPLDAVGIIFGPVDRYARFTHPVRLDDTFFKVTLSTLLSRMGAAKDKGNEERRVISTQIDKLVTQFPKLHLKSGYKFLPHMKRADTDLPLVACYNAIMSYCSYKASGCATKKADEVQVFKRDDDDDLYGTTDDGNNNDDDFMDEKEIADEIYEYCYSRIGHNGLQRFPKLHVTFGLARLCKSLPRSAAEILSRPLDERNQRTPFDLFKLMLEQLERDDLIVDTPEEAVDGKMMAGELEYLVHDAAQVFQDCVKLNPADVRHHAWHIGALSACLLLCSGNQIGSGTRLYPSAKKKRRHAAMQDDDSPWHEIRFMLVKFLDIRMELAKAVRLLFYLAKYQKGPRVSLAISSLLEWREVIGLLVGPTKQHEPWDDILALHKKHVMKWAIDSITPTSQTYIARQERDESALVQFRARELENNPGSIESWRRFVQVLGPIGSQPKTQQEQHHGTICDECKRLREGLFIDHMARSDCRRDKKWLGADRFKTWKWVLLHIPTCPVFDTSTGKARGLSKPDATVKKLKECMPELKEPLSTLSELDDYVVVEDGDEELVWLPLDTSTEDDNSQSEKSDVERSQTFDRILPRTFMEFLNEDEEEEADFDPPQLTGPKALTLEIMCYKILILCHMYDMYDKDVETALKTLVIKSWNADNLQKDSDEWRSLLWLCAMGLNTPLMITKWRHFSF